MLPLLPLLLLPPLLALEAVAWSTLRK